MLPDWAAPLDSLARPFAGDFEQTLRQTDTRRGNGEPAGVQSGQRNL